MKKDKIIYRVTTGLIVGVMLFRIYKMYTPDYDRLSVKIPSNLPPSN